MRTLVVVAIDPGSDGGRRVLESQESMLPDALTLERLVVASPRRSARECAGG
jgi:hypothetical protein